MTHDHLVSILHVIAFGMLVIGLALLYIYDANKNRKLRIIGVNLALTALAIIALRVLWKDLESVGHNP